MSRNDAVSDIPSTGCDNDPVIHTGNELGGMTATKLRITNKSGEEQKVYFKSFSFVKR
jgi:hyaluronoglucosaminidase